MNTHSTTQTENIKKSSIDIEVLDGEHLLAGDIVSTDGYKTIAIKTHNPLAYTGAPLPIGQGQPKNTQWAGIYSLSNSLSLVLAKNKLITVDIDFKKRMIEGEAPLEINDGTFTLNAHFDDAGNISEMFDIDTDSLVSRNVSGKICQNYIELGLRGVGSDSVFYFGSLIAYAP